MRVVGIIAEYNPLHNGHIYHLEEAKRRSGAEECIVVMSGNFVQRGEPACTDKFTRAEWALQAGADLVLELPSCFAVASAERFAEGAVKTLAATGVVTDLAFGVETKNYAALERIANLLDRQPSNFRLILLHHLKEGKSYPRAQYEALCDFGLPQDELELLKLPNNILAIEYLKCLRRFAPHIRPLPIERIGNRYNDTELSDTVSGATAIREAFKNGDDRVYDALPLYVSGALRFDAQFPLTLSDMGPMILQKIRSMSLEELSQIPDVNEGFEQLLFKAVRKCVTVEELLEAVKSRRYTMARCKRILICALLGIRSELAETLLSSPEHLYLRVLGLQRIGRGLLSAVASAGTAPVLLRNSDLNRLSDAARFSVSIDACSTDLLAFALRRDLHRDSQSAVSV